MAADEIERFRRELIERSGDARGGDNISDQELLREVMNTVGKYADVFGIPFNVAAKPVVAPPQVKAVRPERDALEIRLPRVEGYHVELPEERGRRRFWHTFRAITTRRAILASSWL